MSSPFSFFRRNQHVTMVAIVILSMVAFTISDMMTQDVNHFVTLGVLLGGAVMAFVGISRGRWFQYGIAGAITGGILAWIIPGFFGGTGEFYQTSTLGAFDSERIRQLHLRRTIANAFMEQAFGKAFGAGTEQFAPRFGFYPTIEDDAIFGELMLAEAEELGIVVTDAMVSSYINSNTGDKLSEKDFVDIRNNLAIAGQRISETDIIEAFRSEIAAQIAYLQKSPSSSASTQPPAALYDLFLRSQVRQRLNLVRLDVDSFVSRIPDPSDQEVQASFSQHRERFPGQTEPGSIGYRQFNKASLAYLQLDYKAVEAAVPAPTDAEIEAFYNEKKDLFYRKPAEPPAAPEPAAPEGTPETPDAPKPDAPAPDAPQPDAPAPDAPKPDAPDAPKPDAPPSETPKADPPAPTSPDSAPTPPQPQSKPEPQPPGNNPESAPGCGPFDEQQATEKPSEPAPEPTPAAPANAQEKPAEPAPSEAPTAPAQDPAATPAPTTPAEDPVPFVIPPVEYRPLDDELKSEIRDQLHEQKIREEIEKRIDTVMSGLQKLERERSSKRRAIVKADQSIEPKDRAEKLRDFNGTLLKGMQDLGKELGFSFVETRLLSARDLSTDDIVPVGTAQDVISGTPVFQMVFELFPSENDPWNDANLFTRKKAVKNQFAVEGQESHFVWWITEFSPSHVPELTDPGIREEVVLTLKRQKAREDAKKRGEALAKLLNDEAAKPEAERKPAGELLQGQTILDQADSPAVVVRQTQLFSWLEQELTPQMNFMQRPRLRLSTINYADESGGEVRFAGDRFMRAVFEELPAGGATVVPDDELGVFYVAQAAERVVNQDVLRQMFLQEGRQFAFRQGPVADLLAATVLQPATTAWVESIWKKYGIDRNATPE
jgi:hypothetical protein